MKKLLMLVSASLLATFVHAQQVVPIVWPFSAASVPASVGRALAEEANKLQSKYLFHYDTKPGAGGVVAANFITNTYGGIALMTSSSSFFVRPIYYPNESYQFSDFTPVLIQCVGQPYVVVSTKYKSIAELRTQSKLSIGINFGSLTEAIARELNAALPNTDLVFVGYSDTVKPTQDMIAGVLDLTIGLPGSTAAWVDSGKVFVVGASGTKDFPNYRTFHSQGVKGFEDLVSNYQIVVKSSTDPAVVQELHNILRQASKNSSKLEAFYKNDLCAQVDVDLRTTNTMYTRWSRNWATWLKKTN